MSESTRSPDVDRWATDVVIADGGVVRLRPYVGDDAAALLAMVGRSSDETIHFRFFSQWRPRTEADLDQFLKVDQRGRVALVAELDGDIIALGQYIWMVDRDSAEVAFLVDDDHQGRGIGTILLEHLAVIAQANGIGRFHANALGDNRQMLRVFSSAGYPVHRTRERGVWTIEFQLDQLAAEAVMERERVAEAASVRRVLAPRSIAVVGASPRPGGIGNTVFRNIIAGNFTGTVFPVHPAATSVAGVKAFPTLSAIGEPVDVVVVAVPAEQVLAVVEEAGDVGAEAVVVVSAGFAEQGIDAAADQHELVRAAHRHGMRLVGPNCIGVINTGPDVHLNATFAPDEPSPGSVGFASQSGALGLAILDVARELGLGLSSFVSLGNKADLSGNDLLQYWEQDDATAVALLYLESFGNPRKFGRIARRFSRTKPLVVVKGGRSEPGRRAASSHTAALASDDILADTLFRQAGIIRVTTLEQLFDVARLLVHQPLPAGPRVAIVGNSGGPGILAADACIGAGLQVHEFAPATQAALRATLPRGSAVANPVDLIASGTAEDYEAALGIILADEAVDAVLAIFTDAAVAEPDEIAAALGRVAASSAEKPMAATFLSGDVGSLIPVPDAPDRGIPVFRFPEAPAMALGRAAGLAEWRRRPEGSVPDLSGVDVLAARSLASSVMAAHPEGCWLSAATTAELLAAVGIELVPTTTAGSPEQAEAAAREIGGPVALKVASGGSADCARNEDEPMGRPEKTATIPGEERAGKAGQSTEENESARSRDTIQHKTDVGGVVLGVHPDDVARQYRDMAARIGPAMDGALVQPMVEAGVEVIVGCLSDRAFGPVVMFGLGGTATELFADRAFSIVPVTDVDAGELVRTPRSSALLFGYRGAEPVDVAALEDMVLRVSRLATAVPELVELDLNPVIARPDGTFVVDARARLAPTPDPAALPLRRLG